MDTLHTLIKNIYEPAGMKITTAPVAESESAEYGAYRLGLNGKNIVFRIAKTTPTKIGQFVTLWKRQNAGGIIMPLDTTDGIDLVVISVSDATHQGQFVFDQKTLVEKGVMSCNGKGGKRAIRVYPLWTKPIAKDAIKTQQWQLQHFLPITNSTASDEIQRLFA